MPGATLDGFGPADLIVLDGVAYSSGGSATLEAGNTLAIVEGGQTYDLTFNPSQYFLSENFHAASDTTAGTDVTLVAVPLTSAAAVSSGRVSWAW